MFSLSEYKVLLVGLDESGKTSVLERIKYTQKQLEKKKNGTATAPKNDGFAGITANLKLKPDSGDDTKKEPKLFSETPIDTTFIKPTIGLNICKLPGYTTDMDGSNTSCNMLFWDLGGKEPLRTLWYNYTHQCHAVVLVVDASDRERFPEVKRMARELIGHPSLGGFDKERVEAAVRGSFPKPEEADPLTVNAARKKTTERLVNQARAAGTVPILVLLNKLDVYLKQESERIHGTSAEIDPVIGKIPSIVNLFDETGLLEVALETSILPEGVSSQTSSSAAPASGGENPSTSQHPLEIATTMKGSVGVGQRLFKVCPISALYEEEAIKEATSQLVRSKISSTASNSNNHQRQEDGGTSQSSSSSTSPPVEVVPLSDGLDWLVQYLAQNARHVENL